MYQIIGWLQLQLVPWTAEQILVILWHFATCIHTVLTRVIICSISVIELFKDFDTSVNFPTPCCSCFLQSSTKSVKRTHLSLCFLCSPKEQHIKQTNFSSWVQYSFNSSLCLAHFGAFCGAESKEDFEWFLNRAGVCRGTKQLSQSFWSQVAQKHVAFSPQAKHSTLSFTAAKYR